MKKEQPYHSIIQEVVILISDAKNGMISAKVNLNKQIINSSLKNLTPDQVLVQGMSETMSDKA